MKRSGAVLLFILTSTLLLTPSCKKEEDTIPADPIEKPRFARLINHEDTERGNGRTLPQEDRTLTIAVEGSFDTVLNPFMSPGKPSVFALNMVFCGPLHGDGTPWGGTIDTVENPDGTLTATVKIKENMLFSDGMPVTIDDYLYGFYVASDPMMSDSVSSELTSIVGMDAYRNDSVDLEKLRAECRAEAEAVYSPDVIMQEDYETYLIETELEGTFRHHDRAWWKRYAEEEGFASDWLLIDGESDDEVLSLIAMTEVANHHRDWDPVSWWTDELFRERLESERSSRVTQISGIKRIDDHTCTITFRSAAEYDVNIVNKPFVPIHWYSAFRKGELHEILSRAIPVGSGPYKITSLSSDRIRLAANPLYFEEVPTIWNIELIDSPSHFDISWECSDRNVLESLFTEESLDRALPTGTGWQPVLWCLRLK